MATEASKKNENSDNEKKVFDVAKPGSSEPETGTKPMVIGHRSMASDPSMINNEDDKTDDSTSDASGEPSISLSPSKKLTLQPLSSDEKSKTTTEEVKKEASEDATKKDSTDSDENHDVLGPDITEKKPKTTDELQKDKQTALDEREAKLRELIKSGKYTLAIDESKSFNFKIFITTFVLTGALVGSILAVLIDLEILDIGLSLPFDFL